MPKLEQEQIKKQEPEILEDWDDQFGDRHTNLVFIGTDLDEAAITKELDQCLLTPSEFDSDWSQLEDPFQWDIQRAE
ncbi:hypothetical protein RBIBE_03000 [Bacillus velezensis]|nr:hypothetical protein RBIBE_03000 [Bacillus velezensis]